MRIFSVVLFFCATTAQAGLVPFYCRDVKSIEESAKECRDNHFFGEAGIECLKMIEIRIDERAKQANAQLAASNLAHVDQAGNSQVHNFGGTGADYAISQAALAELIEAAKAARTTVDGYVHHVYYPEDWDAPEQVIGNRFQFVMAQHCYSDNLVGLQDIVKRLDKYVAQLETAKGASASRGDTAGSRQGKEASLTAAPIRNGSRGEGSAAGLTIPAGDSQNPLSDISGTKEAKEKDKSLLAP